MSTFYAVLLRLQSYFALDTIPVRVRAKIPYATRLGGMALHGTGSLVVFWRMMTSSGAFSGPFLGPILEDDVQAARRTSRGRAVNTHVRVPYEYVAPSCT